MSFLPENTTDPADICTSTSPGPGTKSFACAMQMMGNITVIRMMISNKFFLNRFVFIIILAFFLNKENPERHSPDF